MAGRSNGLFRDRVDSLVLVAAEGTVFLGQLVAILDAPSICPGQRFPLFPLVNESD
jgi:hypothetical protein